MNEKSTSLLSPFASFQQIIFPLLRGQIGVRSNDSPYPLNSDVISLLLAQPAVISYGGNQVELGSAHKVKVSLRNKVTLN